MLVKQNLLLKVKKMDKLMLTHHPWRSKKLLLINLVKILKEKKVLPQINQLMLVKMMLLVEMLLINQLKQVEKLLINLLIKLQEEIDSKFIKNII
jgi:hypothetical protein